MTPVMMGDLEKEWNLESGFLGMLRRGHFDEAAYERLLATLRRVQTPPDKLSARFVALTWYIPIFMTWQRDRCVAAGYGDGRFDNAVSTVTSSLEDILGVP